MLFDADALVTRDTPVDCGPVTVEFFNDDAGQTPVDPNLFIHDATTPSASNLATIYTEDVLLKGDHPLKYRAYYTNYPTNVIEVADPFIVTVIDPCDSPVGLLTSFLED